MPHPLTRLLCVMATVWLSGSSIMALADGSETRAPGIKGWLETVQNNSRIALDFSNRDLYYTGNNEWGTQNVIGLDVFKVFTKSNRDIGTLVAQAYLTRIDNLQAHPGFFKDNHDTQLVYRIFNFNYTGLPGKAPNIRLGHFEIPFGLEQTLDTNGTLRQYAAPRNLGVKADWGISLNQQHRHFEYEAALTTGGVQNLKGAGGSFTASGRIGTNRDANTVVGLSVYRSKLGAVTRERAGMDLQAYFGRYGVFGELSAGSDNGARVINYLTELNMRNRRDSLQAYFQANHFSSRLDNGWNRTTLGAVGLKYAPDRKLSFDAQISRVLRSQNGKHPTTMSVQARYRLSN